MTPDETPTWPAMGVAARGIVRDDRGRILLIRRSEEVEWDPGLWELPGGKAEHGETIQDALAREALEETGLAIEVGDPVHIAQFTKEPFWVTSVTFACEATGGSARLSDEHGELAWVAPEEIAGRSCTQPTREALDAYRVR